MVAPFDVFRQEENGEVLWIGAAESLEEAEKKVCKANKAVQGTYLVVSQKTGNRKVFSPSANSPSA